MTDVTLISLFYEELTSFGNCEIEISLELFTKFLLLVWISASSAEKGY
jgi:hypothetical protein